MSIKEDVGFVVPSSGLSHSPLMSELTTSTEHPSFVRQEFRLQGRFIGGWC